jgi:asparagine synthase (glutamine-hydrolysing)
MCGIAGVLRSRGEADDTTAVRAALAALAERGPDGEGLERDGPLTLGHRRLAILDLSSAAHQPMRSASGRTLLVFNGEIYNFEELRRELSLAEEALRSSSDTEILLEGWERWGPATLDRLVGQWAFAVFDTLEQRLWLARDRFGEKPLYLHEGNGALSFASSLPALLRFPWVSRELDPSALAEYAALRYVVSPRTVVAGVHKLPPGHLLCADRDGIRVQRWYDPRFRASSRRASQRQRQDLAEEFGVLLRQAARRCVVSDVPVALLLSNGLDSNSIQYALGEQGLALPSFTWVAEADGPGLVAAPDNGLSPQAWDLRASPRHRLDHLVPAFSSFTEPLGDGAALATWLLIRNARPHATVFLCGHGADEVVGGYRLSQDLFRLAAIHRLAWLPPWSLELLIDNKVFGAEPPATRQRSIREASPRRVPAAGRYLIHRPLPAPDVAALFHPRAAPEPYLRVVDSLYARCDEHASDLDRVQEVMIQTFLSEDILSFADSVAMASSAELRMPFLDRDLVEFVWSLPRAMRVSRWPGRSNTKQILRWWARDHLPPEIATRRKCNFNYGSLRDFLREDRDAFRDLVLGSAAVRRALPGFQTWLGRPVESFHGPWEGTLWALLALAIWCEANGLR